MTASECAGLVCRFGKVTSGRVHLWKQQLGLEAPFTGNNATSWGEHNEATALLEFQRATHTVLQVRKCAFDVLPGNDAAGRTLSWVGASPDAVLLPEEGSDRAMNAGASVLGALAEGHSWPHLERHSTSRGILEIKCPHSLCAPVFVVAMWQLHLLFPCQSVAVPFALCRGLSWRAVNCARDGQMYVALCMPSSPP
jgi:hypothetical protein